MLELVFFDKLRHLRKGHRLKKTIYQVVFFFWWKLCLVWLLLSWDLRESIRTVIPPLALVLFILGRNYQVRKCIKSHLVITHRYIDKLLHLRSPNPLRLMFVLLGRQGLSDLRLWKCTDTEHFVLHDLIAWFVYWLLSSFWLGKRFGRNRLFQKDGVMEVVETGWDGLVWFDVVAACKSN